MKVGESLVEKLVDHLGTGEEDDTVVCFAKKGDVETCGRGDSGILVTVMRKVNSLYVPLRADMITRDGEI